MYNCLNIMSSNLVLISESNLILSENLGWKLNNTTYLNGEKWSESSQLLNNGEYIYCMAYDEFGYTQEGNQKNKYKNPIFYSTNIEIRGPIYITKCNLEGNEVNMDEEDINKIYAYLDSLRFT
jgi:hypothetical protein